MFLMLSLNVGGTEKHVYNLISNLNREKFNPVICCLYDLGTIGTTLMNEGFNVYHNLMRNKLDISGVWKFMRILRDKDIHILYTINTSLTQFWGTICAKFTKVYACITRVTVTNQPFHRKRRMIVNKIMLPFVDKIIAQAYSHKDYLIHIEGFNSEKIEVIYNGVNLEEFDKPVDKLALRQKIGIPMGVPVIGIVARLAPEKGHDIFLKAVKKIINVFPQTHFLIVGDGKERKKLEEITHELAIQSNVHFMGIIKDIPQIVSLFDVAVLSSNPVGETVSNAILEYMAASKPVVATNVGSISELVINGETGFLIPCGNSDALADAILRLLKDENLARRLGKAGKGKIEEKFTVQGMVAKYESLFSDLMH